MKAVGNAEVNKIYEGTIVEPFIKLIPSSTRSDREKYIAAKYKEKLFLTKSKLNSEESQKLLRLACEDTDLVEIVRLIAQGANVKHQYKDNKTLIHFMVESDNLLVIEVLLLNSAKLNSQDNQGKTPLHYAVQKLKVDTVKFLLSKSPELQIKDDYGNTALDSAKSIREKLDTDVDKIDQIIQLIEDLANKHRLRTSSLNMEKTKTKDKKKSLRKTFGRVNHKKRRQAPDFSGSDKIQEKPRSSSDAPKPNWHLSPDFRSRGYSEAPLPTNKLHEELPDSDILYKTEGEKEHKAPVVNEFRKMWNSSPKLLVRRRRSNSLGHAYLASIIKNSTEEVISNNNVNNENATISRKDSDPKEKTEATISKGSYQQTKKKSIMKPEPALKQKLHLSASYSNIQIIETDLPPPSMSGEFLRETNKLVPSSSNGSFSESFTESLSVSDTDTM